MRVTEQDKVAEIVDLLAAADGEASAIADLDGCVARSHRSRQAKAALAALPPQDLRQASALRRCTLDGQPR